MRFPALVASSVLAVCLVSAPASAQQHVVDRSAMHDAIADQAATDAANRQVVVRALQQREVRDLADRFGLNVVQAEQALATMSSEQLQELAQPARAITDRTGGDQVIVISVTTLLLVIIAILLIAN